MKLINPYDLIYAKLGDAVYDMNKTQNNFSRLTHVSLHNISLHNIKFHITNEIRSISIKLHKTFSLH
jgi:hypothetical protein